MSKINVRMRLEEKVDIKYVADSHSRAFKKWRVVSCFSSVRVNSLVTPKFKVYESRKEFFFFVCVIVLQNESSCWFCDFELCTALKSL